MNRSNSLYALVGSLLLSSVASADIYKCAGDNGAVVYKNFPCSVESIGSSATAPKPADPPASVAPANATTRSSKASSAGASSDPSQLATLVNTTAGKPQPKAGMTKRQVRNLSWGEPVEISYPDGTDGKAELWTYTDKHSVRFDPMGRVVSFQ